MREIVVEKDSIARAVVELVNQYGKLPCRCEYQKLNEAAYALSLTSLSGTPRVDEDITGDYTGEFPFALYLRAIPDDSADRLDCEQFLSELAAYLERNFHKIKLDGGRAIEEIEQTQTATLISRTQDGANDYQVILTLRYSAKDHHHGGK